MEEKRKRDTVSTHQNEEKRALEHGTVPSATLSEAVAAIGESGKERFQCIPIIGQIEGHYLLPEGQKATKYEQILPLLVSIEESNEIDGVLLLLNTMGGDVEAGLGIAELIAGMKKPTASLVLGGGHSIGVPLAVAASKSFIVPSAAMTIHPVRLTGVVIGAPQTYNYFAQIQERIVGFITAHSRIGRDELLGYMLDPGQLSNDVGTVLTGEECVNCGLIDSLGSLSDALDFLHGRMDAPEEAEK